MAANGPVSIRGSSDATTATMTWQTDVKPGPPLPDARLPSTDGETPLPVKPDQSGVEPVHALPSDLAEQHQDDSNHLQDGSPAVLPGARFIRGSGRPKATLATSLSAYSQGRDSRVCPE